MNELWSRWACGAELETNQRCSLVFPALIGKEANRQAIARPGVEGQACPSFDPAVADPLTKFPLLAE